MKELNLSDIEKKKIFIMAFRYALSRETHVVSEMVFIIKLNWDKFGDLEKAMFKKEIAWAIEVGMPPEKWNEILQLED